MKKRLRNNNIIYKDLSDKNYINRFTFKKSVISLALVVTVVSNSVIAYAAEEPIMKDENVYVNLDGDGTVSGIYVVNSYELSEDTQVTDYGDYETVRNLSSNEVVNVEEDAIHVEADKGKFYYQGNLKTKEMPWDVSIQYILDGTEVTAEELGGKSGELTIHLAVKKNASVNQTFFENYLMQVSLSLDTDICENIQAEGATIANVGNSKQILYNIMAGSEKELVITCDVTEFEMEPISFKGVVSNIDIDTASIDTSEITKETSKITDAADSLNEAAQQVSDGVSKLNNGTKKLKDALVTLDSKSSELTKGSKEILKALNTIDEELGSVSISTQDLSQLVKASNAMKTGTQSLSDGMESLNQSLGYSTMNQAVWEIGRAHV